MTGYFIGIDGGATKTLARFGGGDAMPLEIRSGASSLSQDLPGAIANILDLCRELLTRRGAAPEQVSIACGVAGAGNPAAAAQLKGRLESLGFASVIVTSDAQTSLLGAGAGEPIVMVAIGTGSVAMRLNKDGGIRQFGGWGLAVGDEGSGAAIGKSAVRSLLWELDLHGDAKSDLCRHIMQQVGSQRASILPWLQRAGSREYAALAPVVFEHLPHCQLAQKIVRKTAVDLERLIRAASDDDELPITLLGGLADKMRPFLSDDLRARLVPPKGTSLDGACALAQRHMEYA
ncbi:BadF/BadG/BcrA/BcrD ATPase family protein [Microbulbifer thermotolerans]|uniref:ATPase n=1 Tax=Microbulbifer thermotolerans TaxID=252514 RepID=A0A143HJI9_MICTH|nr:BadF/BadG/BcrA/BcrD ATPase family protein [Microbulbifer thermotolerans]AMX01879.1 ATPase [Microbulbifer thermotolerans]MCX2781671.1 ATPase [Microbulbifer thermotolerans]MCX2793543.1 ATPase [Microbulbifer thermotolerans]MCX2801587.1 ATPase [Microbulbifer thermotolerans]MCX2835369.1 ATPase [Microbulbifer thermotolerans]